jgi:hypothetical protein
MNSALRTITPQAARLEGFQEISVPISRKREPEIFASMEASLAGVDAVWLDHGNGTFSAARRKRDLLPLETLVSADARRELLTGGKAQ